MVPDLSPLHKTFRETSILLAGESIRQIHRLPESVAGGKAESRPCSITGDAVGQITVNDSSSGQAIKNCINSSYATFVHTSVAVAGQKVGPFRSVQHSAPPLHLGGPLASRELTARTAPAQA
jgi:hypothetical protein